ncbi:MAG: winged helix-turn-helix transcriptional regulator [Methanocorpusculum sp.]|nr:winged helix-turn-helix transcriptional regulator [Methanocorpusculum sp.]
MPKIKFALVCILIIAVLIFSAPVFAETPTFPPTPTSTPTKSPVPLSGTITINEIPDVYENSLECIFSGTSTYPAGTVLKYIIQNNTSGYSSKERYTTADENGYWEISINSANLENGESLFLISDLNEDEIFSKTFLVQRPATSTSTLPPLTPTPAQTHSAVPTTTPQKSGGEVSEIFYLFLKFLPIVCIAVIVILGYMRIGCSREPESKPMQILAYIKKYPGSLESDIVKGTEYSRGSTVYNLNKLLKENLITAENYHKTIRYYPADTKNKMKKTVDAILSREKTALIFNTIKENPQSTLAEISKKTSLTRAAVRWHLIQFKNDGVVISQKDGKEIHYSVSKEVNFK